MSKIKIVTDSSSDIPDELLKELDIELLYIPITVDGKGCHERVDFSIDEYYDVLTNAKEIPKTSMVPEPKFYECYKRAMEAGYTDVIVVTIASALSGTFSSANKAMQRFYEENPGSEAAIKIHPVDSRACTLAYGFPVMNSVKMAREGKSVDEILAYMKDWFERVEIHLGVFTLEHAKRCGRISGMSAFIGEALGLRPIIKLIDGKTSIDGKVRGDNKVVLRLFDNYKNSRTSVNDDVIVMKGRDEKYAQDLVALLEKETGRPVPVFQVGAAIITNTGPRPLAVICLGNSRKT